MGRKWFVGVVVVAVVWAQSPSALADQLIGTRLSAGPTFGTNGSGAEVTFSNWVVGPHLSLGYRGGDSDYFYAEGGAYFFAFVGVGVGVDHRDVSGRSENPMALHAVVSLPVPILMIDRAGTIFWRFSTIFSPVNIHGAPPPSIGLGISPYYRLQFLPSDDWSNDSEFGVMVKLSFSLRPDDWR